MHIHIHLARTRVCVRRSEQADEMGTAAACLSRSNCLCLARPGNSDLPRYCSTKLNLTTAYTHSSLFPTAQAQQHANNTKKRSLNATLFKLLGLSLLVPVLPRLALLALTLCQPLMLQRLLAYLEDPVTRQDPKTGYALIGATVVIYVGMAVRLLLLLLSFASVSTCFPSRALCCFPPFSHQPPETPCGLLTH